MDFKIDQDCTGCDRILKNLKLVGSKKKSALGDISVSEVPVKGFGGEKTDIAKGIQIFVEKAVEDSNKATKKISENAKENAYARKKGKGKK